jgi:hypothetical protein
MKTKNAEELIMFVKQGVVYLKYDYEECVFKIKSNENEMQGAWVKFPGERPYKLKFDSKLLYDAMHAMDVISEQEFLDY